MTLWEYILKGKQVALDKHEVLTVQEHITGGLHYGAGEMPPRIKLFALPA